MSAWSDSDASGLLVAQRLSAFGVELIAYDPFVQPARAAQLGVRMVDLDELLRTSDFITVHLPRTKDTIGLIDADALKKVKPTVHIVNAARGGIVDEQALYDALVAGQVAVPVSMSLGVPDSPLFTLDNVVATTPWCQQNGGAGRRLASRSRESVPSSPCR